MFYYVKVVNDFFQFICYKMMFSLQSLSRAIERNKNQVHYQKRNVSLLNAASHIYAYFNYYYSFLFFYLAIYRINTKNVAFNHWPKNNVHYFL